ncbi:MAG TPA: glycosyltransferase family 2 protein [Patescibacteria group bacterium]|nr:glycosyltransferase family 2 protein [Patescibacteria group bacterium]
MPNSTRKKIAIVIPGYNEAKYISKVLSKVKHKAVYIVYVDDGSRDKSAQIARRFTSHILIHKTNLGKGAALKTGCDYAFDQLKAHSVIFMDADDQHDAEEIPRFTRALETYDVVFGERRMGTSMPLLRFIGNKFASILLNFFFGVYIPDIPCGFKAIKKRVYPLLRWNSNGYEVETEIAVRVAKQGIEFGLVDIESIYRDTDKGMTFLDALHISRCIATWKIAL